MSGTIIDGFSHEQNGTKGRRFQYISRALQFLLLLIEGHCLYSLPPCADLDLHIRCNKPSNNFLTCSGDCN